MMITVYLTVLGTPNTTSLQDPSPRLVITIQGRRNVNTFFNDDESTLSLFHSCIFLFKKIESNLRT